MRLLQKVWPWNPKVSWFSRMSNCRAGLSMKMDREIQNICVNPFERCRDYKCESLFADVGNSLAPRCMLHMGGLFRRSLPYHPFLLLLHLLLSSRCLPFPLLLLEFLLSCHSLCHLPPFLLLSLGRSPVIFLISILRSSPSLFSLRDPLNLCSFHFRNLVCHPYLQFSLYERHML